MLRFSALAAAILFGFSTPSMALSVTALNFSAIPDGGPGCPPNPESIVESGYTVSNCPGYFGNPGDIHLADFGTQYPSYVDISGPVPFDALSFSIRPQIWSFLDDDTLMPLDYDNVVATGFRGGSEVAEMSLSTRLLTGVTTYALGTPFDALDVLRIEQVLPGPDADPNGTCFDAPCAHIDLVSVTVAAVPLPAGLPLLAGGLAVLGLAVRRRKV